MRSLGAYIDKNMMFMELHTKSKFRTAYAQLCDIGKIRKYLDDQSTEQLILVNGWLLHTSQQTCVCILSKFLS